MSIKYIINLSSNLFKLDNNKENTSENHPRVFIITFISQNEIFKNFEFWKEMFKFNIIEEMHNQKKYNLYNKESTILKGIKIKNIVKTKISAGFNDMMTLGVKPGLMNKVLQELNDYYELKKFDFDELNNVISTYNGKYLEINELNKINKSYDYIIKSANTKNFNKLLNKKKENKNKNNKNNAFISNGGNINNNNKINSNLTEKKINKSTILNNNNNNSLLNSKNLLLC